MSKHSPSNLKLIQLPQSPSVAVIAMVGVGSRYESQAQNGISHFLEHMVFKGTRKRPSALDITSVVDGMGGDFNAFTGKEFTGFYIKSAAKDLSLSIDVLSDMMFNSKFDQVELERERGVILEEMNMYHDTPSDRVGEIIDHLLYPDQPLGWDIIGTNESLANIDRSSLLDFNRQWYAPQNIVVSIVGSFEPKEIESEVNSTFFSGDESNVQPYQPVKITQKTSQILAMRKESDQTHMVIAVRAFAMSDPRRYALALLNIILGGNMSSRLFTQVRELRGLAYAIHTHPDLNLDSGALKCQLGLDHNRVTEALRVVLDEFASIKEEGVGVEELNRAKSYLRGKLALSLEDPLGMGMYVARQQLLFGKVESPDEYLQKIDNVSKADIQAVANDIFNESGLNVAIIGPQINEAQMSAELYF